MPAICSGASEMPRFSSCTCVPHTSCATPSITYDSPSVAMNSVMGGWLTRGRNTARSMASPSNNMSAKVSSSASGNGTPRSTRLTKVSAANSNCAPCAKFSTPEVL